MEYLMDGATGGNNGLSPEHSEDIVMASVTRGSECISEKLALQENLESGSCHNKRSAIASPLDSIASGCNIEKKFLQENMFSSTCSSREFSISSSDGSVADVNCGEGANMETKPSNITIGSTMSDGENLMEQINLARLSIEEKTNLRDDILVQIHDIRANIHVHGLDYEYAKSEERTARKLVTSKRIEIDHLLSIVNKAKNALAVNDVDNQVFNMERMQHEAPLMMEGQLIQGTKQLKLLRELLSSNLGSQDEVRIALEQREDAEKQLKILRKELVILKDTVLRAQGAAFQAGKKFSEVNRQLRVLRLQLGVANDDLQAANSQWQTLKELWNTVENSMELMNTNDKLCQECFVHTTMGSVGEGSHASSCFVHEGKALGTAPANSVLQNPVLEPKQEAAAKHMILDDEQIMEVEDDSGKSLIDEPPESVSGYDLAVPSGQDAAEDFNLVPNDSENEVVDEFITTAKDSGNLKEKCRLDELAKANEARERKKRQAKKIQMRKEVKAKKEAEQKEKEREKRLRKKENKKVAAAAETDAIETNSCAASLSSEGGTSESSKDISVDPKKSPPKSKQSKTRPAAVPPPLLRNRNKKICKRWMFMCLISVVLSIIFWQGSVDRLSSANLKWEE